MTKLVKIWRVENELGAGPYRKPVYGGLLIEFNLMGFNESNDHKRPSPNDEQGIAAFVTTLDTEERKKWISGFRTLKQYRSWFDTKQVRQLLHEKGFFLTRYEVEQERVKHGPTQTLFIRRNGLVSAFRNADDTALSERGHGQAMEEVFLSKNISLGRGLAVQP